MTENRTVWKSNNQGVKEETFKQTCKGGRDRKLGGDWRGEWSHISVQINQEEQLGTETYPSVFVSLQNPVLPHREIKPQNLQLKTPVGLAAAGETTSLTEEFIGETHGVLEHTQTHPPWNQHHRGLVCLWVAREVTESRAGAE